jgi:hypothetical protein
MRVCRWWVSLFALSVTRGHAQELALSAAHGHRIPASVDTLERCIQPRGEAPRGCGSPYARIVEATANGMYELRNEYFDSAGKIQTVQITRTTPSLAIRYHRVRDTRDSAAMVLVDGMLSAWVVTPGGTRLIGVSGARDRYEPDLVEQALALANPAAGRFAPIAIDNLYGSDPVSVSIDTVRVKEHADLVVNGHRIAVIVVTRTNGNTSWIQAGTAKILARRGSAGPNAFWWHVARGVEFPKS